METKELLEKLDMANAEIALLEKQLSDARAEINMLKWRASMTGTKQNKDFLDTAHG